jgi:hypothetical protein
MKVQIFSEFCSTFFLEHLGSNNGSLERYCRVVVGFAGIGALSVLRKLIIYNWPASKIGKFLAWSPPIQVELGGYSAEFLLLRHLVEAEEGRLEHMRQSRQQMHDPDVDDDEPTSETDRLPGARR